MELSLQYIYMCVVCVYDALLYDVYAHMPILFTLVCVNVLLVAV